MSQLPEFFLPCSESLQVAAQAALAAGAVVRSGYLQAHQIDAKGVGDLVSKIDLDADRAATDILRSADPDTPIVSEELNPEGSRDADALWIVDPLDGSTAYLMQAGPQFPSVLIARQREGQTDLGIVYFPLLDQWYYAQRGQGAFHNGQPLQVPRGPFQLSTCWVEMNQYGNAAFETDFFAAARAALRSTEGALIVTSTFPHAGVAMRIASGQQAPQAAIHDNHPGSLKQGPWDIAPNQIIFEEAGGVFLNPAGEPTDPFLPQPIVIAPDRDLARQILDRVPESIRCPGSRGDSLPSGAP